ncbi:MAG: Pvc16 family protein [Cyanobacteria bacterium J06632_19]
MINAVTQTLASLLVLGTSLKNTEQIDFGLPSGEEYTEPGLNMYCYSLKASSWLQQSNSHLENKSLDSHGNGTLVKAPTQWFDVSFVIAAKDYTSLGKQRLLSEAFMVLSGHRILKEELLAPVLQGYGNLQLTISNFATGDTIALWNALGVPFRPALYVTLTIPLSLKNFATVN